MDPAVRAANAGKHVVVEKPMEITLKRCDAILAACKKNGVQLCPIFPSRFSPANRALKDAIEDGRFGKLTLGENIGDLGGLQVAYQAWRLAVGDTDPEPVDGIPANQRLFFGWAQTWRTILRPQAQKERLATDPHSPDEIRCNQTVRNINEFHDAFGTTPGDALWLEPSERVRIW